MLLALVAIAAAVGLAACGGSSSDTNTTTGASADTSTSAGSDTTATPVGQIRLGAPPEFRNRPTGLPGLRAKYGITDVQFSPLTIGLQYQALDDGKIDVADVFTTDGQLQSGKYVVLTDPRNVFGFQNLTPVVSTRVLDAEGPQFETTINDVSSKLTTEAMQRMNAAVVLDKQQPADVARAFLDANGLLRAGTAGAGKPEITLGTKNFPEQFILGQLYAQALEAQGYRVTLKQNIGSTEIADRALRAGQIDMYPEYIGIFNSTVAGDTRTFATKKEAYDAGKAFAERHGFTLLDLTPFTDTDALAVTRAYAAQHGLRSVGDLASASGQ
ncbi:MAG TPA: glycine betaine ABC transporter substrate-binding protein [Conexibacter sp.]|jgi:osmoprotectant transport system substrate-binding protein